MAHLWEMGWLISGRCGGSLVGDGAALWCEIWWLIGERWGGSLVGDMVAHWWEM